MGFTNRGFNKPLKDEESREPKSAIFIACEGRVTEPEYFQVIVSKLYEYIPVTLEIKIIPKNNDKSDPQKIIDNLESFLLNFQEKNSFHDNDEMWIVIDKEKEKDNDRRKHIDNIIPMCKEKNYNIALTNPQFEFWLLLHLVDIKKHENKKLFDNKRNEQGEKYLDEQLKNNLGRYTKKRGKFDKRIVNINNIKRAIEQEKLFDNEFEKILDSLGSNIGILINKIIKFQ